MTGNAPQLPTRRSLSQTPPVQAGLYLGIGLAIAALLVWAVLKLDTLIIVLVVAGFLAVGLNRPVQVMMRRGLSRWLAMTILMLGLFLFFCGGLALVIPAVVRQTAEFVDAVPGYYEQLMQSTFAERFGGESELLDRVQDLLTGENLSAAAGGFLGGAASAATILGWAVTAVLLSLFILAAHDRIRDAALRLVVASKRERAGEILDRILRQAGSYLIGALVIGLIAGGSAWIFMAIAGIPYAVILAFIVAITDLIPQIGALIGSGIVILIALASSPMTGVAALIFFVVYQQVENWLIYPTIMGSAVKVSNLAALVSVLIGATLFGVVGVVLAVPTYAAVRLVVQELVHPRLDAN